tara:strand:- start:214 stop:483 length:270 start_codon:yes stop_codon:yes gene_type:complete
MIQAATEPARAANEKLNPSQQRCLLLMGEVEELPVPLPSRRPPAGLAEERRQQQIADDAAIAHAISEGDVAAEIERTTAEVSSKLLLGC